MKWARIINNTVVETTGADPNGRYHTSVIWIQCPDEVDQHWEYDGKIFSPPIPRQPSLEEQQVEFTAVIQTHLDAFAQTRNYDDIMSAASYATSTNPKFKAEGQYAVEARDATWAKAYEIMGTVLSGHRPMPTLEEVLWKLPPLAWPEV